MFWLLSPGADSFWYWARNIIGLIVAVTVVGESFHHVPKYWLPAWLQREETHHEISKRSWAVLVVALALEVPIEMARDSIAATEIHSLAVANLPRRLSDAQIDDLVSKCSIFSGTQYDMAVPEGDPEAIDLLKTIDLALKKAGWVAKDFTGNTMRYRYQEGVLTGTTSNWAIAIVVSEKNKLRLGPAAANLAEQLGRSGVEAVWSPVAWKSLQEGGTDLSLDLVHVFVGKKPIS